MEPPQGLGGSPAASPNAKQVPGIFGLGAPSTEARTPERRRSRRKKADDKGLKQLDLWQMQHQRSPTKGASGSAQEAIVIRDEPKERTLTTSTRAKRGNRHKALQADPLPADERCNPSGGSDAVVAKDDVSASALAGGEEKENNSREDGLLADATTVGATAGMEGWIRRPGSRSSSRAQKETKTRTSARTKAKKSEEEADGGTNTGDSSTTTAAAPVLKKQRSKRNVKKASRPPAKSEQLPPEGGPVANAAEDTTATASSSTSSPSEMGTNHNLVVPLENGGHSDESTTAAIVVAAKKGRVGRGRGRSSRKGSRGESEKKAEGEGETSDVTTPTSSQGDSGSSQGPDGDGGTRALRRRSGRLQTKREAALERIKEQEEAMTRRSREEEEVALRSDGMEGEAAAEPEGSSDGHSSPGEQGWMWKRKAGRRNKGQAGRLASLRSAAKPPPVAALPFTTDPSGSAVGGEGENAGQEKLVLRLKVPPSLQMEMRSPASSPMGSPASNSRARSAPTSPAVHCRVRATKRGKRKRGGGDDEDIGGQEEDEEVHASSANEAQTANKDATYEPRRKRRKRGDHKQEKPQQKDGKQAPKPRTRRERKAKDDEVEPHEAPVGEEFFMTSEQREAYRLAKAKEMLKKRTEESKKVDLKLTQGKEIHPFLKPRKAIQSSSTTASSATSSVDTAASSSTLSLSLSSSLLFLPLPPPVPNHVMQLTSSEESFLSSFSTTATTLPFRIPHPDDGTHSSHTTDLCIDAAPLLFGRIDELRDRILAQPTVFSGNVWERREESTISDDDEATVVTDVLDAIHALFPPPMTGDIGMGGMSSQFQHSIADALHILGWYKSKNSTNAENVSTSSSGDAQLWTEKYRPRCAREMIGHVDKMTILARWLLRWKEAPKKSAKGGRRRAKARSDDGDDHSFKKANLLLVQGGTGIGKTGTSAVYACAEEYGFRVLEINPSVERTGAHIKHLVEEATQSRNVASLSSAALLGDTISPSPPTSSAQGDANSVSSARCSLVLFEEVDVVFRTDKGFFSALKELLRIAKTPIVLTCNRVTEEVEDLLREFEHIDLRFERVRDAELVLHLQLICLAEGTWTNVDDAGVRGEDVVSQTEEVKQMVEHVGGDVRRSLLTMQFWMQKGCGPFSYLSWLGFGDVASRHGSLASLMLPATADLSTKGRGLEPHERVLLFEDRLRLAGHSAVTSLLHCNLFSFFPRVGSHEPIASQQQPLFVDCGIMSTAPVASTDGGRRGLEAGKDSESQRAMVPMMDGLDFLCDVLSFNDAVKVERRKRKIAHHGMDITPEAFRGREMEALTSVLGLSCLPASAAALGEDLVEELAVPHKHNKQLTIREGEGAGYEEVYGEVVPRVQHVSRYGGVECFGMAQHIARLDALNRQAKEGRRKRRHVNCLGLDAVRHAWLMRHAFPLVPPSLVDPTRTNQARQEGGEGGAEEERRDEVEEQRTTTMTTPTEEEEVEEEEEGMSEEKDEQEKAKDQKAEEEKEDDDEEGEEQNGTEGEEAEEGEGEEEGKEEEDREEDDDETKSEDIECGGEKMRMEEGSSQFISAEDEFPEEEEDDDEKEEEEEEEEEEEDEDNAEASKDE